jgi:predicted Na+-dependent transporter
LGLVFIFTVIAINFYLYPQMFDADWKLWFAAFLLPIFGLGVGYLGSRIACLTHKQCRTVGIEVSTQNVALCITLIYVSFKIEEASKIVIFPLIFGIFSVLMLLLFTIACRITFVIMKKRGSEEQDNKSMPSPSDGNCSNDGENCVI